MCEDLDECVMRDCDINAVCHDSYGGYSCVCNEGYTGAGTPGDCADEDECALGTHDCHAEANCTNTDGGWECACVYPFVGNGTFCEIPVKGQNIYFQKIHFKKLWRLNKRFLLPI